LAFKPSYHLLHEYHYITAVSPVRRIVASPFMVAVRKHHEYETNFTLVPFQAGVEYLVKSLNYSGHILVLLSFDGLVTESVLGFLLLEVRPPR